ncbi:MAG: YqgE/AlgH family protein [Gammaproteobacteria bacterium]
MDQESSLRNHLLIAMPAMRDPNFHHTVTYICEHNENGAIGIIINRPMTLQLQYIFDQMNISSSSNQTSGEAPVLFGGPIQHDRGFIIHRPAGHWNASLAVTEDIAITTSQDILQAIAKNEGPDDILVALGYAGWGAQQLEQEMLNNTWLSCPANMELLFETPFTQRWQGSGTLMGIDLNTLSGDAGHA